MAMQRKMPPSEDRAMPMARATANEAEPSDWSILGSGALMFLMQAPPVAVLQIPQHAMW